MHGLVVADEVMLKEQEGDAFLLHVPSGRYFGLNRSGLIIWEALTQGHDPVDALGTRWPAVPEEQRRLDVERLVGALLEAGLLQKAHQPPNT